MTEHAELVLELPTLAQRAVAWWKHNKAQLPASYIKKDGTVDVDGLERAAWILYRLLGADQVEGNIPHTFVIFNQVGFKADLQRQLVCRVPGYDFEVLDVDDEHCTARLKTPTGWKPPITKRITDKDIETYAGKNRANYDEKPRRMLEARVTTELVDLYAKGVLTGLVRAEGLDAYFADQGEGEQETSGSESETSGEVQSGSGPPPRSIAPDGTTIPEHLREPEVDADARAMLLDRLGALDEPTAEAVRSIGRELRLPNVRTNRFTKAHAALLWRLINEALEQAPPVAAPETTGDSAVPANHRGAPAEAQSWIKAGHIPVDDVPDRVYDEQPEALFADDDPARPF